MVKQIKRGSKIFGCLIFVYFILMVSVMSFQNKRVESNVKDGIEYIRSEGDYPQIFHALNQDASQLDNFTDRVMMNETVRQSSNPFVAGLSINNYPRYWHGYLVLLRPALAVFSYWTIRYWNMFLVLILFGSCFSLINRKLGIGTAISYSIAMTTISILSLPLSLQYSSVFYVLSFAIIASLSRSKPINSFIYLMVIGSVVNFLDLLTYPLITLGIPLIILIMKKNREQLQGFKANFITLFNGSMGWVTGYALTWLSKWIIASIILRQNVIADAIQQIFFRSGATSNARVLSGDNPAINHKLMLGKNLSLIFQTPFLKLLIVIGIIWLILCVIYRPQLKYWLSYLPILMISIYPYIWYLALSNHSQVHYWMTYKIQAITVFGILMYGIMIISSTNFKQNIANVFHNFNIL